MNLKILLIFGMLAAGSLSAQVGRVSAPETRERSLDKTASLLEMKARSQAEIPNGRADPFAPVPLRAAPVVQQPVVEAGPAIRLSDARAVQAIASNFSPAGSIILGDRRVLRLQDGSMLREGDEFIARIDGVAYRVVVTTIDTAGYVISVGEASLRRGFTSVRGSVSHGSAPPGEPPPQGP